VARGRIVPWIPAHLRREHRVVQPSDTAVVARPRVFLSPPDVGADERELLLDAFDSNYIAPLGEHVDAFEEELADHVGSRHAVALSSGTAGLHLALLLLGVGRDDDVLVSSFTFAASANAITYVGARPVLVDSDLATWNMDPDLLAEELHHRAAIGRLPAAVIVVDLYGQCADYHRILPVCRAYDVPVIEDAAEALGATYRGRGAGTLGDLGVFSFNGNKIITTSGGGMLVADHGPWIERARHLSTQAREPAAHYEHAEIGFNYRMSNLLAAVGRGQLRNLDRKVAHRRRVNARYREGLGRLPGIAFMPDAPFGEPTNWLTCIRVDAAAFGRTRDDVRLHLESLDIESRPTWKPMHLQRAFEGCPVVGGDVSAAIFADGLCLPSGSNLEDVDLDRVIEAVRDLARD
jgi:dTDP-4-amino-4,6-dideoxygalactose transaminase